MDLFTRRACCRWPTSSSSSAVRSMRAMPSTCCLVLSAVFQSRLPRGVAITSLQFIKGSYLGVLLARLRSCCSWELAILMNLRFCNTVWWKELDKMVVTADLQRRTACEVGKGSRVALEATESSHEVLKKDSCHTYRWKRGDQQRTRDDEENRCSGKGRFLQARVFRLWSQPCDDM